MTSPTKTRIKIQARADGTNWYSPQYQSAWNLYRWHNIDSYVCGSLEEAQRTINDFLDIELKYTNVGKPTYIKYP